MPNTCETGVSANCIEIVPIFQSLTPDEMAEVETISTHRTFEKGEMVYHAGNVDRRLYIVHRGRIKISRYSEDGKEQVIRLISPGEFMGELSLFSRQPTTDFAQTLEPSTVCLIEGTAMEKLMRAYPSISFKIIDELSRRLERVQGLVENLALHSVEWRLAQTLLQMMDSRSRIVLPMTKGLFASQLGMTQETLSRKLSAWSDLSWIALEGQRTIRILRPEKLRSIE